MKIIIQKLRNCWLNKCLIIIIAVSAFTFKADAQTVVADPPYIPNPAVDSLIQGIHYDYQIFYHNNGRKDCRGKVYVRVSLTSDVDDIFLEASSRKQMLPDRVLFNIKTSGPDTTTVISMGGLYWNCYFRLRVNYKDGRSGISNIYSIRDYIDKTLLNELSSQASIMDINDEMTKIHISNRQLYIDTREEIDLVLYDSKGSLLMDKKVSNFTIVPFDNISSPFIILYYRSSTIENTKKILLQ